MRVTAIILVVGVFLAHDGANWLAEGTRFTPAAVFYMLHGAWEAVLSALLLMVLAAAKVTVWRDLALGALVISIVEATLIPTCRLAVADLKAVPRGVSLCDYATGLPLHASLLALEVFALCWIVGAWARNGNAP